MIKSISDDEQNQLRKFVHLVLEMDKSRFILDARNQKQLLSEKKLPDGNVIINTPDYDWEDFKSFLTTFRQVALLKREPAYLPKIKNIVARYADDELRKDLDKLKQHIFPIIEGKYVGMKLIAKVGEKEISLTSYELLDAIVNGMVFHGDQDKAHDISLINISKPWEYILIIMSEIVTPVFNACVHLMELIRSDNYLDASDFQ